MAPIFLISLISTLTFHSSLALISSDVPHQTHELQTYIVHVQFPQTTSPIDLAELESWYNSFLPATKAAGNETSRLVYAYHNVFTGFAAELSPEEAKEMENKRGFVLAQPQKVLSLHTTHSPNFLGLKENFGFWAASDYGEGTIIGLLDTGIKPDHPSFSDEGMRPPPAKWKGRCEFNFTACNNKIIGARSFTRDDASPLDQNGHGTHTASTAAGNFVKGANVFGSANGTAVGIAPRAHIAMYKVCNTSCSESAILAALDAAIDDGVDVISISLGGFSGSFYSDSTALGAFSAMQKGIFVSASAGNSGPLSFSLSNEAPWILTVGASTIDRKIIATVVLGDKQALDGESAFQPMDFPPTQLPLVYPALLNINDSAAPFCSPTALNRSNIRGKFVLCEVGGQTGIIAKGQDVKAGGGVGMILMNPRSWANTTLSAAHVLPASYVSFADGQNIINYINRTKNPTAAIIFKGTIIGDVRAPVVAGFSSRGPNFESPGILKPDIIGPGVNILAAWPISVENNTNKKSTFNIISGTSMSCPHLSGVAALLKTAHPDWSPAAIKSAIMTTADLVNLEQKPIEDETYLPANIFAIGAGHVNPSKANDPGLVYDIQPDDYIPYLCGLNYTKRQVGTILQRSVNCTEFIPEAQLNYPSLSIKIGQSSSAQTYTRTVTNVGEANESYTVQVIPPTGVKVTVVPTTLNFLELNQKLTYQVTFEQLSGNFSGTSQGYLIWSSGKHFVRSPMAVVFI